MWCCPEAPSPASGEGAQPPPPQADTKAPSVWPRPGSCVPAPPSRRLCCCFPLLACVFVRSRAPGIPQHPSNTFYNAHTVAFILH